MKRLTAYEFADALVSHRARRRVRTRLPRAARGTGGARLARSVPSATAGPEGVRPFAPASDARWDRAFALRLGFRRLRPARCGGRTTRRRRRTAAAPGGTLRRRAVRIGSARSADRVRRGPRHRATLRLDQTERSLVGDRSSQSARRLARARRPPARTPGDDDRARATALAADRDGRDVSAARLRQRHRT